MPRSGLVILGIDPGLANTGWGVIACSGSAETPVAYGCISTSSEEDTASRLLKIHQGIQEVIDRYSPDEMGIEDVFFGINAKSAFAVGQARGAALIAAGERGLTVGEYPPLTIKQTVVGSGKAEKEQVQYMVKAILSLDHTPSPDHCSDALAAAICHARMRRKVG